MRRKGRIFKIKSGYNPNSSSIGTEITIFLWSAAGFAVLANTVWAIIASVRSKKNSARSRKEA